MRFKFRDNSHMRASILFILVQLGICWTLRSLVHHFFLYTKHGKKQNTLFLLSETEKYSERENTKTKLTLLPAFSSCVQLIHFVGFKQQLSSYKEQSEHIHHHKTLLLSATGFKYFFRKTNEKKKYLVLLGFQHCKKKKISAANHVQKNTNVLKSFA